MKFTLRKASDRFGVEPREVEIGTLDDLKKLYESEDYDLIVRFEPNEITVYDDYVE